MKLTIQAKDDDSRIVITVEDNQSAEEDKL